MLTAAKPPAESTQLRWIIIELLFTDYLAGRRGGPVRLVTGDYTMEFTARAAGIQADLTPAEIVYGDGAGSRDS